MTTIHDEGKIKELLESNIEEACNFLHTAKVVPRYAVESILKEYAEHIRQKTIDECIACVPKPGGVLDRLPLATEDMEWTYECVVEETITNLEQLKNQS